MTLDQPLERAIETRPELAAALRGQLETRRKHRDAAIVGADALDRLMKVMQHKTGQGFKLRRLLFSLWSGTAIADLSELLCLDYAIREDFCAVLMGWGFEDPPGPRLFYSALEDALAKAGLRAWFDEESEQRGQP